LERERQFFQEVQDRAVALGIADRIRFLGQRKDVHRLFAAADIHCQPNTGPEPFGIAFVEALYAGLPVVTSNFGGGAEIVDASCGILTPPGDVDAVATALRLLITDPARRRQLGRHGASRAATISDPGRQLEVLRRLLSGGGG
jgi:glycosyltransferase involved in cell wall biosynthesis